MLRRLRSWFGPKPERLDTDALAAKLQALRDATPAPVFWLIGRTQSGKTSLVKYLTGADDAAIGNGFRPCTRTSREYPFPNDTEPVLKFLDTRGVDEPGYNPTEDLAQFNEAAHLVIVTVRLTDFTTGNLREALATIRSANPKRPVVLILTCLHEAFPQQQHPHPYPFDTATLPPTITGEEALPTDLTRLVREQAKVFAGLVDRIVPVDLTKPEEGFTETAYGGKMLKTTLLALLPDAYRTVFLQLQALQRALREEHIHRAMPTILRATTLAATASAAPIPGLGLMLLPDIQKQMLTDLATQAGTPDAVEPFLATLSRSLRLKQALRELVKFLPGIGMAASAGLASRATYALGVAFSDYLHAKELGQDLSETDVKQLYQERLNSAASAWTQKTTGQ
jgi:uncharacterized protein (DUF697 family)